MNDTFLWLIGIVVAFVGVGRGLVYQGEALINPVQNLSLHIIQKSVVSHYGH